MLGGKKHLTAQSTQETPEKLNRYTFLDKSSAQMDEQSKKHRFIHEVPFEDTNNGLFCVRFNNDSSKIITAFGNGMVQILDMESGEFDCCVKPESAEFLPVMCVRCVPAVDDTFFAAGISGNIYICNFEQDATKKFCEEKLNEINSIDVDITSNNLVSAGKDACIRLYDINNARLKTKYFKPNRKADDNSTTRFHATRIFAVKFHPTDESIFITGGSDDTVKIWDSRIQDACVKNINGPRICGEALDIKEKHILTGSWTVNNSLQMWDMTSGRLIETINPINRLQTLDGEFLYCCQFFKGEGHEFVLTGGSGTSRLEIISIKDQKIVASYKAQKTIQTLDSCTKSFVVFGGMDPVIKVLHIA